MDLGVNQISPEEWGARKDYDSWGDVSLKVNTIFIHWPGTDQQFNGAYAESKQALRSYENYHLGLTWRGLAYDWAIDLEGRFFRVRGLARSAATGGDIDEDGIPNNAESDAILLLIGPGQQMSKKMLATLETVCKNHRFPNEVYGHRESAIIGTGTETSCPGDIVMVWVKSWRNAYRNPPVGDTELAHLSDEAQEFYQAMYEEGQKRDARPTSLWNVLDLYKAFRSFFERGY